VRYTVSDFPAKGNQLTSKEIVELAQLTERVGIDRFSITDFPFHQDCIPLMTACLVGTERLEVESLVTTPYLRMPDVTACTWATMAELSGSRAILGIGKGGARPPIWVAPWGYDRPNGRVAVRELVETCRTMWAGGRPVMEGRALHTSGLPLDFPFTERVPVLVAARGLKMLKVGAEIADIVHIASPFAGPKYLRERVDYVRNCALEAGRDLDDLEIDITISLSVARDGAWARDVGRMTTAAAILWVANAEAHVRDTATAAAPRPEEFNVPDSTIEAIANGWDMWTGEPLPPHLVELITEDILDQFSVAGEPKECAEKLDALVDQIPGITGLRFKLPPLFTGDSNDGFREMVTLIGEMVAARSKSA
jgi:5,10-methylenetetrahydromethanopterin reductase